MNFQVGRTASFAFSCVVGIALGCAKNQSRSAIVPSDAGSDSRADGAPVSDWAGAMASWRGSPDHSIYSINFFAPPPDGLMLRAVSYASEPSNTCLEYSKRQHTPPDDWILQVLFSRDETGTFQVRPTNQAGGEPVAHVLVIRTGGGVEVERHTGLAGTLQVDNVALTAEEQLSGASFVVHGDVDFSTNEADNGEGCAISGGDDALSVTCYCRSNDGGAFTCNSDQVEPSCCIDLGAPRTTFHIALRATPCPALCATTDLALESYCAELGPDGADGGTDAGTRI